MKKILYLLIAVGFSVTVATGLTSQNPEAASVNFYSGDSKPDIPENVYKIVERSCFHCHSDSSSNFAAKGKLNFTNWNDYSTARKISRLDAVCNMITKGKMPKKSFIKDHPDKALSPEEREMICKWTAEASDKLLGE
jgi:hypothetical protein